MNESKRQQLIQQLREALHQAETPLTAVAEFEILDTEFSVDFTEDEEDKVFQYEPPSVDFDETNKDFWKLFEGLSKK